MEAHWKGYIFQPAEELKAATTVTSKEVTDKCLLEYFKQWYCRNLLTVERNYFEGCM
jgi:hypothetical protein